MSLRRAALATALLLTSLAGCNVYRPGGSMRSNDTFTFISNEFYPVTVTIVDVRSNEPIWTADVPVGKQLTFRFHEAQYPDNPANPDAMRWQFFDRPTRGGELNSVMAVPDKYSRRMDVSIRKTPEYATGSDPRIEHANATGGKPVMVTPGTPAPAPSPTPAASPAPAEPVAPAAQPAPEPAKPSAP
ncbi:MAG: hypothetical protein U0570_12270 [Phycisphaerales bacterium]